MRNCRSTGGLWERRGLWEKGGIVKSMRNCRRKWRTVGKHRELEGKQEDCGKAERVVGERDGFGESTDGLWESTKANGIKQICGRTKGLWE